jgi:Flp pilus assembly protein TadG
MRLHRVAGARTRFRKAAAAVEFAVVSPLLFTAVLGIIEFGRAMMVLELLNNAARAGCRTGVLSGSDNSAVSSSVTTALSGSGISTTPTVQVNGTTANASTAQTGDTVTVSVSVSADTVSWLPVTHFLTGKTLTGTVTMRRE